MPSHRYRRQLLARMGRAIAVNPLDAEPRMELGRFFAWHGARHRAGSERAVFYHRLAADRFAEAVLARPTSGYTWALLAEQWALAGQSNERVIHALARAAELSPMEPGVQLKSLWLALGRWEVLDEPLRVRSLDNLRRLLAVREYFGQGAGIVIAQQRMDLLRGVLTQPWQYEQLARLRAASAR